MALIKIVRDIVKTPLNRDRPLAAIWRFVMWQIGSRLVPGPVIYDWIDGAKFIVSRGETSLTGNIYRGLDEFHDMAFVLHALRAEDLFVDVGANAGSYTILACAVVGARGVCFEPVPTTYGRLLANLRLNDLEQRVHAVNQGLADEVGVLRFSTQQDCVNHVLTSMELDEPGLEIAVGTLDSAVLETPALIKIDVEGFETKVLAGAKRLLQNAGLHSILIELNGSGSRYGFSEDEILDVLRSAGFKPYRYDPFERRLAPLEVAKNEQGNTLFVRNLELVQHRVAAAQKFRVFGRDF